VQKYRSVQLLEIFRRLRKGRTGRDFLHNRRRNVCKCCDGTGSPGHVLGTRSRNLRIQ